MMILLNILWFVLVAYILIYVFVAYLLIITSSLGRNSDIRRKRAVSKAFRILNIVIYAKDNIEDLVKLINTLKSQGYPEDKYIINIIIDNKNTNIDRVIEHIPGMKIWKLNSEKPASNIYAPVSQYLERSLSGEYVNGYVFLSSSSIIKDNFLQRVNTALEKSDISQACIGTKAPYASTISALSYVYNRIRNRTTNAGVFHLLKNCPLQEQGLIISQTLLEKCPLKLTAAQSEVDYNFTLINQKIKVDWAPEIIIYDKMAEDIHDLSQWKIKKLIKTLKGIKNSLLTALLKPEGLLLSVVLLKPGNLVYLCICLVALISGYLISFQPYNVDLWFYIPSFCFIMYVFAEIAAMLSARCYPRDLLIWLNSFTYLFPECYLSILYSLKIMLKKDKPQQEQVYVEHQVLAKVKVLPKDYTTEVIITDGKKTFSCQLTTHLSEQENKVVLMFKSKKFSTKSYPVIEEAFKEINEKLEAKGFKLIICNNCGYFAYSKRSHKETSGASGHCFYNKEGQKIEFNDLANIWNSCAHYCPKEKKEQILQIWKNSLSAEIEAELNKEGNI